MWRNIVPLCQLGHNSKTKPFGYYCTNTEAIRFGISSTTTTLLPIQRDSVIRQIWPYTVWLFIVNVFDFMNARITQYEQIEWMSSLCIESFILYLVSYTLWDCYIASILSICNWIFNRILFAVRPSLNYTSTSATSMMLLLLLPVLCFVRRTNVLENDYWFFSWFWWRQRNKDKFYRNRLILLPHLIIQ